MLLDKKTIIKKVIFYLFISIILISSIVQIVSNYNYSFLIIIILNLCLLLFVIISNLKKIKLNVKWYILGSLVILSSTAAIFPDLIGNMYIFLFEIILGILFFVLMVILELVSKKKN